MKKRKFSKVYMLDVRANITQESIIDYLIKTLLVTISKVSKSSKVSLNVMDRDENGS